MSTTWMSKYLYLSRTLDGTQAGLPGISDRGRCPGAACWLPHDLACLVPDEKRRAFFPFFSNEGGAAQHEHRTIDSQHGGVRNEPYDAQNKARPPATTTDDIRKYGSGSMPSLSLSLLSLPPTHTCCVPKLHYLLCT